MGGVVLETLSNKKLFAFSIIILILQVACYLIGGIVSPKPYNVQQVTGSYCDASANRQGDEWYPSRGNNSCKIVHSLKYSASSIDANRVVFTFQFPLPRHGKELEMSRWHQNLIGIITPYILYYKDHNIDESKPSILTMRARFGARNKGDKDWKEIAYSLEDRPLTCVPPENMLEGHDYQCDPFPVFELGCVHYDYYLLNIQLPADDNENKINNNVGKLEDLHFVAIHPNGGFTKVWYSYKIVFFPTVLVALVWYWLRVKSQTREPNLLEWTLFTLGAAMTFLNIPVEVFTLFLYMPFMLLFSDIRQGIFYSVLLCFWILFAGEHLMDTTEKNRLVLYWKQLSGVLFGCICLFVFEMCERGVQLSNPFYSIWSTDTSSNLAYAFIIVMGITACIYFLFLFYLMVRVWRNLNNKKANLPTMQKARRKYYVGIIFRFKFMIVLTLFCAALTVIFFIIGQVSEGYWKWDNKQRLEHATAFMTGIYGMWNLYVLSLLILYAPSPKVVKQLQTTDDSDEGEEIEFSAMPSEASSLTHFAHKAASD